MDENPTSAFRSKLQGIFKELGPFYSASPLGLLLVVLETGLGPGTSPPRIRKAAAISGVVPAILNSEMKLEAAQEKIPRGERCLRTSSVPTRNIQKCQQLDLTFRSNVGPSLSEQTAASGGPAEAGGPDPTRIPALIWPLEQCNISTEGLTPASRSFSDSQNPPGWTGGKANRAEEPVGLGKNIYCTVSLAWGSQTQSGFALQPATFNSALGPRVNWNSNVDQLPHYAKVLHLGKLSSVNVSCRCKVGQANSPN